jgi:hypothetical protein
MSLNDNVNYYEVSEFNQVGLKAFDNITTLWKLDDLQKQALLNGSLTIKNNLLRELPGDLTKIQRLNISYIIGIYKNLQILFADNEKGDEWIKKKNVVFNNLSALEFMIKGGTENLQLVRRYLDSLLV